MIPNEPIYQHGRRVREADIFAQALIKLCQISYPITDALPVIRNLNGTIRHESDTCAYEKTGPTSFQLYVDMLEQTEVTNERCVYALLLMIEQTGYFLNPKRWSNTPVKQPTGTLPQTDTDILEIATRAILMPSSHMLEPLKQRPEGINLNIDTKIELTAQYFHTTLELADERYRDAFALTKLIQYEEQQKREDNHDSDQ